LIESGTLIGTCETIIAERETLLRDLQEGLDKMAETYNLNGGIRKKLAVLEDLYADSRPNGGALSGGPSSMAGG
jgi:hypothetical protein